VLALVVLELVAVLRVRMMQRNCKQTPVLGMMNHGFMSLYSTD